MPVKKPMGLYIHIPFCKSKCFYCDFNSFADKERLIPAYFQALKREVEYYAPVLRERSVETVFIGGGTPSVVETKLIYDLMNQLRSLTCIEGGAEVTIETNPGTLTYEKLTAYRIMGINRLSMGLQSTHNHLLRKIGRIHTVEEFLENYQLARKVGFKNINLDLMFSLPGQTLRDWDNTLKKVAKLEPEHVSCYSLKIEEGTVFGNCLETGEMDEVDDELDREMYYRAVELLNSLNLRHYEISNFARPGYECRHNLNYWAPDEYLGLGAGAHSYLDGKRFNNLESVEEYNACDFQSELPMENQQVIDRDEEMKEYMILGLRLVKGIQPSEFQNRFGEKLAVRFGEQIEGLVKRNLLEMRGEYLRLTSRGLDFANEVFVEFV